MGQDLVKRVFEMHKKSTELDDILGISYNDFVKKVDTFKPELEEILKTGSYSMAGIKFLRWLGLSDEQINVDNLIKAIMVIRRIVFLHNKLIEITKGGK